MPKKTFAYDVFISHSDKDRDWVREKLLPLLEAHGLRVCVDFRDFEVGAPLVEVIERTVRDSRKTVLVLTPDYLRSAWSNFEALLIQTLDIDHRKRRLLPVRKARCKLPPRISYLTYIDLAETDDEASAWSRLLRALEAQVAQEQSASGPVLFVSGAFFGDSAAEPAAIVEPARPAQPMPDPQAAAGPAARRAALLLAFEQYAQNGRPKAALEQYALACDIADEPDLALLNEHEPASRGAKPSARGYLSAVHALSLYAARALFVAAHLSDNDVYDELGSSTALLQGALRAVEELRRLRQKSGLAWAHYYLATYLHSRQQFDEMERSLKQAEDAFADLPNDTNARKGLSSCYHLRGRRLLDTWIQGKRKFAVVLQEARHQFEESLRLNTRIGDEYRQAKDTMLLGTCDLLEDSAESGLQALASSTRALVAFENAERAFEKAGDKLSAAQAMLWRGIALSQARHDSPREQIKGVQELKSAVDILTAAHQQLAEIGHAGSQVAATFALWRTEVLLDERAGGRADAIDEREQAFVDRLGAFLGQDLRLSKAIRKALSHGERKAVYRLVKAIDEQVGLDPETRRQLLSAMTVPMIYCSGK